MLILFKFIYRPCKIENVFVWINKNYLCIPIKLIIYVIVTEFLIYNIYFLFHNM